MRATVQKITEEIQALHEAEFEEFLSWLADYELRHPDRWDREIARDCEPGGRLDSFLERVREDIAEGRTKPLDEVVNDS